MTKWATVNVDELVRQVREVEAEMRGLSGRGPDEGATFKDASKALEYGVLKATHQALVRLHNSLTLGAA